MPPKKNTTKDPMDAVLKNIGKAMGRKPDDAPMMRRFGDMERVEVPVLSFGIPAVDDASKCGGVLRGKIVELYGPESSGKSLLSLYLIGSAQKQLLECALLDVEHSFDPIWAAKHGVDVDKLFIANDFEGGENAMEFAYQVVKSRAFGLVVIDSTAALTPIAEIEGSLEDNARVGAHAQMMSRGCRKINNVCGPTDTTVVFINQIREKIGGGGWGPSETTPGGRALKFYSHQRIRVARIGTIKVKENGEDQIVGQKSLVKFVKNKLAPPYGQAEFQVIFDESALNPVVMLAKELKSHKFVTIYGGLFRIAKDKLDNKKSIETGAATYVELADYLINNEYVIPLLEQLKEEVEYDPTEDELDGKILELLDDQSKIVSPSNPEVTAKTVADGKQEAVDDAHVDATEEVAEEPSDGE